MHVPVAQGLPHLHLDRQHNGLHDELATYSIPAHAYIYIRKQQLHTALLGYCTIHVNPYLLRWTWISVNTRVLK